MAARRLIMVLLVLLLVSSIAAALVPIERSSRDTSTTTTWSGGPFVTANVTGTALDQPRSELFFSRRRRREGCSSAGWTQRRIGRRTSGCTSATSCN